MLSTIRKRQVFVSAANSGLRCRTHSILLQSDYSDQRTDSLREKGPIVVGFTATKKLGNAVIRNRAKRRMRAAARECLPHLARADRLYVMVARDAILDCSFESLCKDLRYALTRVNAVVPGHV